MTVGSRRLLTRWISRTWWFDKSKELAAVADAGDVLLAHPWASLWWAFPIHTASRTKCWEPELLSQSTLFSTVGALLFWFRASLEVLVLVPANELSQGQPSASEGLESENKCPFSPSVCGTVVSMLFMSPQNTPEGLSPSSGFSVPLPSLAFLSLQWYFPDSLTGAPWDHLLNKLSQVTHTNPGPCLSVFCRETQTKIGYPGWLGWSLCCDKWSWYTFHC